jgi:hypothetical protein
MWSNISHAWRSWKSAKATAIMSVIALAVGIGGAAAVFTVANTVLLKPVPYTFPDRWQTLFGGSTLSTEAQRISALSLDELRRYQEATRSFDVFGWYFLPGDFNLTSPGEAEHVNGVEVTPTLIEKVGVQPALGTSFMILMAHRWRSYPLACGSIWAAIQASLGSR